MTSRFAKDEKLCVLPNGGRKGEGLIHVEHWIALPNDTQPGFSECRFAVLTIFCSSKEKGYVVYDRLFSRIIDGVYYGSPDPALGVAAWFNEDPDAAIESRPPNNIALGLIYPDKESAS